MGVTTSSPATKAGGGRSKPKNDTSRRPSFAVGQGKDIMISYSHTDVEWMRKIKERLESAGISVWVDEAYLGAGVEFLSKIGQAIVDAKLFLSLLSTTSVKSKYCKDELALAYVSNKLIFPCALQTREELSNDMDFGMKLTLAPMKWIYFSSDRPIKDSCDELIIEIKLKLKELKEEEEEVDSQENSTLSPHSVSTRSPKKRLLKRQMTQGNMGNDVDIKGDEKNEDFWKKYFKGQNKVLWTKFKGMFNEEYGPSLDKVYSNADKEWLLSVLHVEINEDGNEFIEMEDYDKFCTIDGEKYPFWDRVHEEAVISYTMKEVFSFGSSVRLDAIQNLAKIKSPAVVEALLDLCKDSDHNVQSIAAISLAHTGSTSARVTNRLLKLCENKDRLVRESACLALGHLKIVKAVPKLIQLWRNDTISHVREAAEVALDQIGGEEAETAMHITKVLQDEIRLLSIKT
ncbi:uncharacterized protein LOC102803167 [Saccoglossus kowalevskii]|uniref:Uncharacterized protein LOC102803167 n=1 Tax=Saccoglossus kowalevskii TaxID=10224 RepID=A0ABM0LVA7_SACKO|nr:PREDICTED: uncharacterized protein LOC102803167 [Saccoglossus kowalevskii]